jgi:hypothetical protein
VAAIIGNFACLCNVFVEREAVETALFFATQITDLKAGVNEKLASQAQSYSYSRCWIHLIGAPGIRRVQSVG